MDDDDYYYDDDDDYYFDDGLCYCPECCAFREGFRKGYNAALFDLGEYE